MEDGSFRCDANISLRPVGSSEFFTKVEVKNMNSFKAVYRALEYEAQRQKQVLESGERLTQETRGWVEEKGITVSQRSKEYAHDYRYFPEPDLPPLTFSRQWVEELYRQLPELPDARRDRFMTSYGLSAYDASLLTSSKSMAAYFETCLEGNTDPKWAKVVSNWLLGEFNRLLNLNGVDIIEAKVKPQQLVELLNMMEKATLSGTSAKEVFQEMFNTGKSASQIVDQKGLTQISDSGEIDGIITQVLTGNAQALAEFKAGKAQVLTFLLGQVMRASRGRANPQVVRELLQKRLVDA
jgi:aspartyl-tRNA(Asn)/glutamyl-tRNA(Gln) amidotransferase subunit B